MFKRFRKIDEASELRTRHPCGENKGRSHQRSLILPRPALGTLVLRRCCPKCGARWQVTIRPSRELKDGTQINVLDWVRLSETNAAKGE